MRSTLATVVVIGTLTVTGCTINSGGGQPAASPEQMEAYQAQVDAYNQQIEQTEKFQQQQAAELERAQALMATQEQYVERYGKVVAKWEEQAKRMDVILDVEERRAGIKPTLEKGPDSTPQ